jgi:hypothetical protein
MSNNKQTVKLYTHEEIVNFLKKEFADEINAETFMENLTPIELPSDSLCINCDESKSTHNVCIDCMIKIGKENIELPSDGEIIEVSHNIKYTQFNPFANGAIWMRDKIQGGNNEQQ